jgi:hypothetical protein
LLVRHIAQLAVHRVPALEQQRAVYGTVRGLGTVNSHTLKR